MDTCGPTVPSAEDRVSELVSDRPISSLSRGRHMGVFAGMGSALSRFRFSVLPFLPFRFALRPGRSFLSDY